MPYDEKLDSRISELTSGWGVIRKKMFGGTCYLLNGNMAFGVYEDFLIIRLGNEDGDKALNKPFVRPFNITGRVMRGWIMVAGQGCKGIKLRKWLDKAYAFVQALPPK